MPDIGQGYSEDGFRRQRRNLVMGTAVLLLVHLAEIQIPTGGTALGVSFKIGHPRVIDWALFAAVIYWAIRFYQYHRVRSPVELRSAARQIIWNYLQPHSIDYITPKPPQFQAPGTPDGSTCELRVHDFGVTSYERHAIRAHVNPAWFIRRPGEHDHPQIISTGNCNVLFKGSLVWRARVLGYLQASINTPFFTDYILPYIFFAGTISFALYRLTIG